MGLMFGRIAYLLPGGLNRTGQRNLQLAFPEKSEAERRQLLRGCFENLGRLLGEFSQLTRATPESLRKLIEYDQVGLAHLRAAEKNGRGIIFLTGHVGSWELLSFGWSALEYPISFLVRPIDNPRVEEMIEKVRTRFGNRAIDKKSAARQSLRVLRDGGTLGILSDLNSHPHEGVFVPFFGKLACTTAGIATLALKTDAVVIPTCAVWDKQKKRYFFHGDAPVELMRTGDHRKDVEAQYRALRSGNGDGWSGFIQNSGSGFTSVGRRDRKGNRTFTSRQEADGSRDLRRFSICRLSFFIWSF